jgi:hypothetical protein
LLVGAAELDLGGALGRRSCFGRRSGAGRFSFDPAQLGAERLGQAGQPLGFSATAAMRRPRSA